MSVAARRTDQLDNEGNWVPTSRVNYVKPGGFCGHVHTRIAPSRPTTTTSRSCGCRIRLTIPAADKCGSPAIAEPFGGDLLHLSYGKSSMFKILKEEVDGQWQGGAVRFPLRFDSASCADASIRMMANSTSPACVSGNPTARVTVPFTACATLANRFTPTALNVEKTGIRITFTNPLDATTAVDDQNWAIDQWNYQWTQNYGSKMYSPRTPPRWWATNARVPLAEIL